jgi:hypothetical protein
MTKYKTITQIYFEEIALSEAKKKAKLDPVGKEDSDIDNDGVENDENDKYIEKRRETIGKAISKKNSKKCEECGKSPCECEDVNEEKNVHGEIEVPSKNLSKLIKKAVKRIDTDVDGDVDKNDPSAGDFGEFVPSVDGKKRVYTALKNSYEYSNWREELIEVVSLVEKKTQSPKVKEGNVNNYSSSVVNLKPQLKEAVENLGGVLLEAEELDNEPQDIFENVTDAEVYLLDDYTINYVVENVIFDFLDEGYDIDYICDSIMESVNYSLEVLNEATAMSSRVGAAAHNRAAQRATQRASRRASKANKVGNAVNAVKNLVKSGIKGAAYGTGYVAGAGVRAAKGAVKTAVKGAGYVAGAGVRAAKGIGSQASTGYAAGRKKQAQSGSSTTDTSDSTQSAERLSGSQTPASGRYRYVRQEPKQKNLAQRFGDGLRRLVARGLRSASRGSRNLARTIDVKETFINEKAESEQQQKLFGLALSVKRGKTPRSEVSPDVLKIVDSMSEKEIRKYAGTPHKGIPKKKI